MTIKDYRQAKNLTQEQVARMLDITLNHYQNIEKGKNIPSVITGLKMCKIFEVDPYNFWNVKL